MNTNQVLTFSGPFEADHIQSWAKKVLQGDIYEATHTPKPIADNTLPDILANFEIATASRYQELTDKELNIVLVTYTSEAIDESQQLALAQFNRLAQAVPKFKYLAYDVNLLGPQKGIEPLVPAFYARPAQGALVMYEGDFSLESLAKFVGKQTGVKVQWKGLDDRVSMGEQAKMYAA